MKTRGFTLIELLVVIAIIAVLAAILFPVFVQTKEKARASACLNHGVEIGKALMMYVDDWNGTYPIQAQGGQVIETSSGETFKFYSCVIWNMLDRYTKNKKIWICPSAATPQMRRYALGYRTTWFYRAEDFTYGGPLDRGLAGYGDPLKYWPQDPQIRPPDKISSIRRPAQKVAFYEGQWGAYQRNRDARKALGYLPHLYGGNYVYADGHARYADVGTLWYPEGYVPQRD